VDIQDGVEALGRQSLYQWKVVKPYETILGDVSVVGKADAVQGMTVTDVKLTFGHADPDWYVPSLQWRFYLDIFNATYFRYLVFQVDDEGDMDYEAFHFSRYEGMHDDCTEWLERFLAWAAQHDLLRHLDRPQGIEEVCHEI
jgi:hypothetical protein